MKRATETERPAETLRPVTRVSPLAAPPLPAAPLMARRAVLMAAAGLAGCSVLPQTPYLQRRAWPLVVRRPTARPAPRSGPVLLVRSVSASPALAVRGLQWLQPDGSLHVDFYEEWAVPPAEAVGDDLQQWLADAGLFAAVIRQGSRLNADFVLEAQLTTFIAEPRARLARAALALVLLDQGSRGAKVRLQQTESADAPLPTADAPAMVSALQAALGRVLEQTERAVAGAIGDWRGNGRRA